MESKKTGNGPVWKDKNGNPFRCMLCGKPRMRSTPLCEACKLKFHKDAPVENN